MDVVDWLRKLGLEQYAAVFRENAVTADLLPDLTPQDLKEIGVTAVGIAVVCCKQSLPWALMVIPMPIWPNNPLPMPLGYLDQLPNVASSA